MSEGLKLPASQRAERHFAPGGCEAAVIAHRAQQRSLPEGPGGKAHQAVPQQSCGPGQAPRPALNRASRPERARAERTQPSRAVHRQRSGCSRGTAAATSRRGGKPRDSRRRSGRTGRAVWEGQYLRIVHVGGEVNSGEAGSAGCGCHDRGRVEQGGRGRAEPHGCHGPARVEQGRECHGRGWCAGGLRAPTRR